MEGLPVSEERRVFNSILGAIGNTPLVRLGRIGRDLPVPLYAKLTLENRQVVPSDDEILSLIENSNCTAYDCEFVALARQLNVYLVTADKQLLKEFPDCAISLEEFVE